MSVQPQSHDPETQAESPMDADESAASATNVPSTNQFMQALLASNPFERNRITDLSQMDCDVASIHRAEFTRLTETAEAALRESTGKGLLLLGSAGVGKSHTLARLSRWAAERKACFIFLRNIQVRPDDVSRYLLKCCINRLAEDRKHGLQDTTLFRVVREAICKAAAKENIDRLNDSNYQAVFQRLAKRIGGDEAVFDAIFRFYFHAAKATRSRDAKKRSQHDACAALALRWLKGELLDRDEAEQIGRRVRPQDEVTELGEDQIEAVLLHLARLAKESAMPFVLCIDQADNMQHNQLSALCRSLHSLIDGGDNLLVVLAGVREDLLKLISDGVIHAAAADRLNHTRPIELRWIKRSDARLVLQERLSTFVGQLETLPTDSRPFFQDDSLFPLGEKWFQEQLEPGSVELRPRDVLTWASDRWRNIQDSVRQQGVRGLQRDALAPPPNQPPSKQAPLTDQDVQSHLDQKIAAKLEEHLNAHRLQPAGLPDDAGNLLGLTLQLLEQCVNRHADYTLRRVTVPKKSTTELLVEEALAGKVVRNHVVFIVTQSKQSTAAQLRNLLNAPAADHRILVTADERSPLQLGVKGQEYFDALTKLGVDGFQYVKLTFEQYALLDAIMAVVGDARSGDLECEPRPREIIPISEAQVIDAYHRHDRYRKHPLLHLFLTEEVPVATIRPPFPPRQEFREFVTAKLSFLIGANLSELTKSYLAPTEPCSAEDLPHRLATAREMHREELVSAKPWDDDLFLTVGRKA